MGGITPPHTSTAKQYTIYIRGEERKPGLNHKIWLTFLVWGYSEAYNDLSSNLFSLCLNCFTFWELPGALNHWPPHDKSIFCIWRAASVNCVWPPLLPYSNRWIPLVHWGLQIEKNHKLKKTDFGFQIFSNWGIYINCIFLSMRRSILS